MDLMKLFRRRKSSGKPCDASLNFEQSRVPVDCEKNLDVNLNSNSKTVSGRARKEIRGWRRSFRSIRKKNPTFSSNSCDDILQDQSKSISCPSNIFEEHAKRWSYSPDSTREPCLDAKEMFSSFQTRRNTDGKLELDNGLAILEKKAAVAEESAENPLIIEENCEFPAPPDFMMDSGQKLPEIASTEENSGLQVEGVKLVVDHVASPSRHQIATNTNKECTDLSQRQSYLKDQDSSYRMPFTDCKTHSTIYERDAEQALDNLHRYEDIKDLEVGQKIDDNSVEGYDDVEIRADMTDDNVSWGSNEFDTDSDESGEYDNETSQGSDGKRYADGCGGEKNYLFRKHKEISRDISRGVRKLKFLERKSILKKNSKEEEPSLFVDFHISTDHHPGPQLQPAPPSLEPYQLRRRNIVETIIQSEGSYIDSLERLEINYKKSLIDSKPPIVSADIIEKIFYKVGDILQCHQLFQIALTEAVNNWDEHEKIGDTFVASFSKSMVLECYSSYINNFSNAMELVRKTCKQKPQFLPFLRDRQNESQNRLNLYGLMLKPVQRFPQFILLVQDLLKSTPKGHGDHLPLQLALTELETLAENLNQRRANDEENSEMVNLLNSSNIKLISNLTKDGRTRRLLRKDFIRECTYTEEGAIEKDRECLLVLTNDMLLSCSCTNRRQQQRSGISTFRDLYKLKWCATLDIVTITDGLSSSITEYTKMKADLSRLHGIRQQVECLHFSHNGLSSSHIQDCISSLETKIKQTEHATSFSINFPQKSGDFKRTLVMPDSVQCNEWLESITDAKLANDKKNLHCWFSADGSDSENLWKPPLFMDSVCPSNNKALQVQCAYAFMPASHITLLWLACSASTVLTVVNVYQIIDDKIEKVHVMQVDSSVQCIDHWNPSNNSPSVWLGMECGSLIEFSADAPYGKLCEVTMPTMSTVMIMKGFERNLYVGLLDGSLLMYTRPEDMTGLTHMQSITVGSGPLNCLFPLDGRLWGSSGNDIVTINLENFEIESIRTVQTELKLTVGHVVQVGSGLWVAFCDSCNLHLYHLDSLKLLQDLNLSRPIRDFFQGLGWPTRVNETCSVTSLWSSYWQLVVGTSNGLILTMPLPKLADSVPKITGPCRICYHMLSGPVNFLCAPEMPTSSQSFESNKEKIILPAEDDVPPEIPVRSPVKPVEENSCEPFRHKRTSSEGLVNVINSASPESTASKPMKKRFSSVEPYTNKQSSLSEPFNKLLTPPALPPKPNTSRMKETADVLCEELLEDDFVFNDTEVEKLASPKRTLHWRERRARKFPVLLACGEGYSYLGKSDDSHADGSSSRATTILCWKIVTRDI